MTNCGGAGAARADALALDPDRLLPVEPTVRAIARELYAAVADEPIVSPHGHIDAGLLLRDEPFADAAELLIRHDHYVTRLLHAAGIPLPALGLAPLAGAPVAGVRAAGAPVAGTMAPPASPVSRVLPPVVPPPVVPPRDVWRALCEHWLDYAGTATGYWLREALVTQFGITDRPSRDSADRLFDTIGAALATPGFRPRALLGRFRIEVLATTDDPMSDLAAHAALAADPTLPTRVLPTFRPDAYLDPTAPGWQQRVEALAAWNGTAAGSYAGFLAALEGRRRFFIEHGAVSADHGAAQPCAVDLDSVDAATLFDRCRRGTATLTDQETFAAHMLLESARMSVADGLVMCIHPGIHRNHASGIFETFGPDMGADIPVATEYVAGLKPLLDRFGNEPAFHLVLFTVDEATFSREIAPLAGFYPAVYIGAPWWFLDAPDAVRRFRAATTETAGLLRGSGFVDDTRALLSIPARHDMSRRLDAGYLARLVAEGRIAAADAHALIRRLVVDQPKAVFKL